jgi:signal transduction histidine kinase
VSAPSTRSVWPLAATVAVVGASLMVGYGIVQGVPTSDWVQLVLLAGGVAVAGAVATGLLLVRLRTAALGVQVTVVTVVPLLSVLAGTWLGAKLMFLSQHDLTTVAVLLLAAGTVGCVAALVLGARVAGASRALLAATQDLANGVPLTGGGPTTAREIANVRAELQTASDRLREARSREQALESSRRELIAWVSHDLRTPLAGIRAIAEALEDGVADDPETVARYHASLRTESDRLAGLVDDLFELSQAQAGVVTLQWDRISLRDLVSDAVAGVSPVAAAKGVRVDDRIGEPAPEVVASPPELLRALRNLLENAVRHTPTDGSIVVEAGADGGEVFVAVQDDGGGIRPDAIGRVFEVGFRADPARGRDGGAGLGLAIARELVEAHAGTITVENRDGGARFEIRLPADRSMSTA